MQRAATLGTRNMCSQQPYYRYVGKGNTLVRMRTRKGDLDMVIDESGDSRVHDFLMVLVQNVPHANLAGRDELNKLTGEYRWIKTGSLAGFERLGCRFRQAAPLG